MINFCSFYEISAEAFSEWEKDPGFQYDVCSKEGCKTPHRVDGMGHKILIKPLEEGRMLVLANHNFGMRAKEVKAKNFHGIDIGGVNYPPSLVLASFAVKKIYQLGLIPNRRFEIATDIFFGCVFTLLRNRYEQEIPLVEWRPRSCGTSLHGMWRWILAFDRERDDVLVIDEEMNIDICSMYDYQIERDRLEKLPNSLTHYLERCPYGPITERHFSGWSRGLWER